MHVRLYAAFKCTDLHWLLHAWSNQICRVDAVTEDVIPTKSLIFIRPCETRRFNQHDAVALVCQMIVYSVTDDKTGSCGKVSNRLWLSKKYSLFIVCEVIKLPLLHVSLLRNDTYPRVFLCPVGWSKHTLLLISRHMCVCLIGYSS